MAVVTDLFVIMIVIRILTRQRLWQDVVCVRTYHGYLSAGNSAPLTGGISKSKPTAEQG